MSLAPPPAPLRLSSRPLAAIAVAFAVGIVAGRSLPWVGLWAAVVGVSVAVVGLYVLATRRSLVTLRRLVLACGVVCAAAGAGGVRMSAWSAEPPDGIVHVARAADAHDDRPVTVWARIAEVPTRSRWSVRFAADVDSVALDSTGGLVSGRVQVSLVRASFDGEPHLYPALRLGDRVRLTGALATRPRRRNPADMDYGAFLSHRGLDATLRVRDGGAVRVLAPTRRLSDRVAIRVQRVVRSVVAGSVPDRDSQAVLLALLLADRSDLEDATTDAFRSTGLMHLLAVSGLHVFLVGLAVFALLGPLLARAGLERRRASWRGRRSRSV